MVLAKCSHRLIGRTAELLSWHGQRGGLIKILPEIFPWNGPSAIAGAVSPPYSTGCLDTLHNTISIVTSSFNLTPCPVTPPFSRMPRDTRPMPSLISRGRRKGGQTASFFLEGGYATQIKPFQCIFGLSVSVVLKGFVMAGWFVARFLP